jgi:hypothetical protein
MLSNLNTASDLVILIGSLWILLTSRIPTRTGSSIVLSIIGMSSLGNLVTLHGCPAPTEVSLKVGVAMFVAYAWYRIEAVNLFRKRAW